MKFNASRGGHAPGDLRDAFEDWVIKCFYPRDSHPRLIDDVSEYIGDWNGRKWTVSRLLGTLWDCTDIVPWALCGDLDLPSGSTYAQVVRRIKADLREEE